MPATHDLEPRESRADRGFTLIELLVVVVIIGILVAIAIPLYLNYTGSAKADSLKADVHHAVAQVQNCYSELDQVLPAGTKTLTSSGPLDTGCSDVQITISSHTEKLVYQNTSSGGRPSYTIAASDLSGGTVFTYDSTTGEIVQTS